MARIILVTGGANSGKSKFAEDICLGQPGRTNNIEDESKNKIVDDKRLDARDIGKNNKVLYIATAKILDSEMAEKKKKHLARRASYGWDTLEAYRNFDRFFRDQSILDKDYNFILFDCLTMMVTNILFNDNMDFDAGDKELRLEKERLVFREIDKLLDLVEDQDLDLVFVTNELGMGLIGDSSLSRYFLELASKLNRYIADRCQAMYFVVSGQPIRVK